MANDLARQLLAWMVLWGAPFAVYGLVAQGLPRMARAVSTALYGAWLLATYLLAPALLPAFVKMPVIVFGYFALASVVVFALGWLYERELLSRPAALVASFAVCGGLVPLVLPASAGLLAVVFGWERAMASFSWIVDGGAARRRNLSACITFLLVNPVIVYAERGRALSQPSRRRAHVARLCLGVVALLAHSALYAIVYDPSSWTALSQRWVGSDFGSTLLYVPLLAACVYFGHSGRASIGIGWMRLLGWQIPERYDRPFLARNPIEFWRRWNIYVGSWARRYVYNPALLYCRRRGWRGSVSQAIAIAVTFMTVGLLHDAASLFQGSRSTSFPMTAAFLLNAGLVVAWLGMLRLGRSSTDRPAARRALFGWCACQAAVLVCVFALPAALRDGFALNVSALLHKWVN